MKDSGVSYEELKAKVEGMIQNVTDPAKKQKIHLYGPLCSEIFRYQQKRDLHGHSLEDYFQTHLSWLTDTQKNEIRKLKE
ncbi:ABA1 protein, partial [Falcunculus frontatus]|nr:ABA1 protein [Falcunculus frontatus]